MGLVRTMKQRSYVSQSSSIMNDGHRFKWGRSGWYGGKGGPEQGRGGWGGGVDER